MTWAEAARCPFAMNKQLPAFAIDNVPLNLASIVRYVIQQRESGFWNDFGEGATNQMRDNLPVRQSAIRGCAHCAEIPLAKLRAYGSTRKFAIRNWPEALAHHRFQVVSPDLMAEASRAAMDGYENVVLLQPQYSSDRGIKDLSDPLHFQVVVARSERSHFVSLPLFRLLRDEFRPRVRCTSAFFNALKILRNAVSLSHSPLRATAQHLVHLVALELYRPGAANPGRNAAEQGVGNSGLMWLQLVQGDSRTQRADSTGNVKADATGRDDSSLIGIEGGAPANRKTIAPVSIGHRVRRSLDSGQRSDVG